ncbi:unnamed protein product [Rotaria sp. Silwood1]|nr:unnamed protein product [Rotaria sp. Silwood1]
MVKTFAIAFTKCQPYRSPDCEALRHAENEARRLGNELEELTKQLADKHSQLNQAEEEKKQLATALAERRKELDVINQNIQKLEQDLAQCKSQLNAAIASLNRMTEVLRHEQQLELECQRAVERQTTVVNEANNQANEANLKEAQAKEAANRAMREQLEAQTVVDDLEGQLNEANITLVLALAAVATALLIPIAGEAAALALGVVVIAAREKLRDLTAALNRAKSRRDQATRKRGEALTLHRTAEERKRQAYENLDKEKQVLEQMTTAWKQQIEKKNAAKRNVDNQTKIVEKATVDHENVQRALANAKQQQITKTNEVYVAEAQVNRQTARVETLRTEVNVLQNRQNQTQNALIKAETTLKAAQTRSKKAESRLQTLNVQVKAKKVEVENTEKSVQQKQQEIQRSQTEYAISQEKAWRAANKVAIIQQDLDFAEKNAADLEKEIQVQTDKLLRKIMSDDILEKIKRGENLSGDQLARFANDLLDDEACDDAFRIFLALVKRKATLSSLVLERLCRICIDEYQPKTKEDSLKIIETALENNQKLPDILDALSIALEEEDFPENRRYASKMLYYYILTQHNVTLDAKLLEIMADSVNDSLPIVQSYMLLSFEELVRNHQYEIPPKIIDRIEELLLTMSTNSSLLLLVLRYVQNGQKLPNQLIDSLTNQLPNDKDQIFIQILYYVVHNEQSIPRRSIEDLIELMCINETYSKYTIQILKLLISRNEIEPNDRIYENCGTLLKNTHDSDLQRLIIETIAYSLQNTPIHNALSNKQIIELIEHYFQISTNKDMKYYTCLALCSIIDHGQILSEATLHRLKLYAQEYDPTSYTSSKIDLRTMAINALQHYIHTRTAQENTFDSHECETIINRETLGKTILENVHSNIGYDAANTLLSMIHNDQRSLSTFNMKVLESCLKSDDASIELKIIVIKIFQNVARFLEPSHIISMIILIDNPTLSEPIVKVIEQLIQYENSFPDPCFHILLNFISECIDSLLRDRVIDDLEAITKYDTISSDTLSLIRFEITSKELRNPNLTTDKKSSIINQWIDFASKGYKLSKNVLESLEHILKNRLEKNEHGESMLTIIEFVTRNGQRMPSELMKVLNHLLNQGQLNRTRIINIINTMSNVNQELITQEILTNSEKDLLENLSDSYSILVKGTQNGCQLSKSTTNHLMNILKMKDKTKANELLSTIQIVQNLAANTGTLDNETIRCLEKALQDTDTNIQKSILNTLKYLSNYKPSPVLLNYLRNFFTELPAEFNIQDLLEKCMKLQIQDILHITHTLLVVEYVQEDTHDKPIHLLCRNLLCSDLLLQIRKYDKYDQVTQFKFYANLSGLENYFGFSSHSLVRDEALVFLIENHSNFTLNDINEILLMLTTNEKAFYLIRVRSNDWLQQLRINWLQTIFTTYPHIKELNLWEYFTKKEDNRIDIKDIYVWSFELECDLIKKKFIDLCELRHFNHTNLGDVQNTILEAYSNNWSLEIFEELFEVLKTKNDEPFSSIVENFLKTFSIINNYAIKSTVTNKDGKTARSIFKLKQSNEWLRAMQKIAVFVTFDEDEREKIMDSSAINKLSRTLE